MAFVLNERVLEVAFVLEQIAAHASDWEGDRYPVADVGSGPSHLPHLLANCRVSRVDAFDPLFPQERRGHHESLPVCFFRQPFEKSNEQARYAVITCVSVLEHLKDPQRLLAAIAKRLAPGGLFVCTIPFAKPARTIRRSHDMVYARPLSFWLNAVPSSWSLYEQRVLRCWRWTPRKWVRQSPGWVSHPRKATVAALAWRAAAMSVQA